MLKKLSVNSILELSILLEMGGTGRLVEYYLVTAELIVVSNRA